MAEEKKESKGQRRYGHGRKIMDKKPGEAGAEKKEASSEGGDGNLMGKDTQDTPMASDKIDADNPGSEPKPDVMAGTDGISVQDRHRGERDEMAARHAKEAHQMHERHAKEHEAMIKKHQGDMQTADIMAAPGSAGSPAPDTSGATA